MFDRCDALLQLLDLQAEQHQLDIFLRGMRRTMKHLEMVLVGQEIFQHRERRNREPAVAQKLRRGGKPGKQTSTGDPQVRLSFRLLQ